MHLADQSGVLVLIRLLLGWGESGHPHLLGVLPHLGIGVSSIHQTTISFVTCE